MKEINLVLTLQEVELIGRALGELPLKVSVGLFNKIHIQVNELTQKPEDPVEKS